ncbi:uncharacterized protein LOC130046306 [Ostrea edulis]|uniref:uncharacterized protein LOC130046306 n=1 Tax=Ostrea edulis TaxID=37623 RepID=UPI0024AF1C5C|nr:uncharacterized protein LOC130046306 [Ostrea edulis]XP_056002079.1 uncharacterized protein LOC130046306 [Ostrea edulis]
MACFKYNKHGTLFGDSSRFLVFGFCLNIISLSLNLVGFATPFWVKVTSPTLTTYTFGLWRLCKKSPVLTVCESIQNEKEWFRWIQVTASVGFGSLLLVSVILGFYIFMMEKRNWIVLVSCVYLTVSAAVLIFIPIVAFGATKMEDMLNIGDTSLSEHVHFSYVFSVISMVTCCVTAMSLVFDIKCN